MQRANVVTIDKLTRFIAPFEGFSPKAYRCPAGVWTIGYGHALKEHTDKIITQDEGMALLALDAQKALNAVHNLVKVELNENETIALADFVFNLGSGAFQRSTLRMRLNRNDRIGCASEFPKWVWAGGKIIKGLRLRRLAERDLFLGIKN